MNQYNYKQHHFKEFSDFDKLRDAILKHGNFTNDDLVCICKKIGRDAPPKWLQFIRAHLVPLVGYQPKAKDVSTSSSKSKTKSKTKAKAKAKTQPVQTPPKKKKQIIVPEHVEIRADDEIYTRKYKASDFRLEDGYIEVNGVRLESKRIKKTSSDILNKIEGEFSIAKDHSHQNRFKFVPRTDLSILLDAIDEYRPINRYDDYDWDTYDYYERANYNASYFESIKSLVTPYLDVSAKGAFNFEEIVYPEYITPETYGPEILFDILKSFNIIAGKSSPNKFKKNLYQCNVMVDIKNVTVSDGHIDIELKDLKFLYLPWERICENAYFNAKDMPLWGISNIKMELQEFITNYLSTYFSRYKVLDKIRVNTHISTKCFYELFDSYRRETKKNPITYESAHFNGCCCNLIEPNKLVIPYHYLNNTVNNGYDVLLHHMRETRKDTPFKNLFTSEATKYFDKANQTLLRKLSTYGCWSKQEEDIKKKLLSAANFIREVTPFYRKRFEAKGWLNDQCPERLFRFYENCAECYDNTEITGVGHISYLAIDTENCRILLCPTNSEYNHLSFKVADKASLEIAALVIMKYFNSSIYNKRREFKFTKIFKRFGINSCEAISNPGINAYKML